MTFDGKTYTFPENCSYYLVKEIITKHNLTITTNRNCGPSKSTFCPQTLTVQYRSDQVVFTQESSTQNVVSTDSNFHMFGVVVTVAHVHLFFRTLTSWLTFLLKWCGGWYSWSQTRCHDWFTVFSNVDRVLVLQVYLNKKRIYPAYSNSVLHFKSTNMMITLTIPEINTVVTYRGSSFTIDLPAALFKRNTEGQCGELPDP